MGTPFKSAERNGDELRRLSPSSSTSDSVHCHAKMRFWSTLILSLSAVSGVIAAKPVTDTFQKYQSLSRSGPVSLNDAGFEELTKAPRDYYAAVILTAMDVRFGCEMCRQFDPEWSLIGKSWNKGEKPEDLKVIFGTLDFDEGKAVFQKVSGSIAGPCL